MDLHNSGAILRERFTNRPVDPRSQQSIESSFAGDEEGLPTTLSPGERVLLSTAEVVKIPLGCLGYICLRSTFARLGLLSPPTVADAGFHGTLTLEVTNTSVNSVLIDPGVAMWSLHYLAMFDVSYRYKGRYQGQSGITKPRAIK